MRILVTGATGFLGSHVARALVERGDTVRILRRPDSPLGLIEGLAFESVTGDVLDPGSLGRACEAIDAIVHCAAQMAPRGNLGARLESHVEGTHHLLEAARRAGVERFVYTSSVASLGIPPGKPAPTDAGAAILDERHAWNGPPATWRYGHAKLRAEALIRAAADDGFDAVIVNPALVIGPGDRNRVSNGLIYHMSHGRVPPRVAGGLNAVHVDDVVDGFLGALDRGRRGERYLLCGENYTLADLVSATARVLGLSPPRWQIPLAAARAGGEMAVVLARMLRLPFTPDLLRGAGRYFYYDGGKARRELGVGMPRPYAEAALASAEWYRHYSVGSGRPL